MLRHGARGLDDGQFGALVRGDAGRHRRLHTVDVVSSGLGLDRVEPLSVGSLLLSLTNVLSEGPGTLSLGLATERLLRHMDALAAENVMTERQESTEWRW